MEDLKYFHGDMENIIIQEIRGRNSPLFDSRCFKIMHTSILFHHLLIKGSHFFTDSRLFLTLVPEFSLTGQESLGFGPLRPLPSPCNDTPEWLLEVKFVICMVTCFAF